MTTSEELRVYACLTWTAQSPFDLHPPITLLQRAATELETLQKQVAGLRNDKESLDYVDSPIHAPLSIVQYRSGWEINDQNKYHKGETLRSAFLAAIRDSAIAAAMQQELKA